jgi:alpha-1,2-mannosyltransferase
MSTPPAESLRSTTRQRWFVLGLLLFFVVLSVFYTRKAIAHRSAFLRWRPQIEALPESDIYERFTYPNPPIMALMLEPFVHLPPLLGSLCWFYLKVAMTLVALYWVFRLVESPDRPFPPWAKALTILLSLRPVMGDLAHGNVNLFILFLVAGALYAYHRQRDWTAGVVLALAIACKVTPALFVPYFLWKRSWKVLGGCALGLVLFFFVVPGLFLGPERNLRLLGSWVECMVTPYVVDGTVTSEHPNQSLPGLVYRLGSHSPSFLDDDEPPRYHNLADLDPHLLRWLVKGCMAAFALLAVWTCRTPVQPRSGWRLAAEFALVVLGMLLFSERTWKHHCVTLVLPFAVIAYYLAVCRPAPPLRGYLIGSLVVVMLLMASTSTSLLQPLDDTAKMAQVYGAYVWSNLVLVAALTVLLRRPEGSGAEAAPVSAPKNPSLAA